MGLFQFEHFHGDCPGAVRLSRGLLSGLDHEFRLFYVADLVLPFVSPTLVSTHFEQKKGKK